VSVCLSVCNVVHCGGQGRCTCIALKKFCTIVVFLVSNYFLFTFFRHFCCRMRRSATKHTEKTKRRKFAVWNSFIA